MIAAFRYQDQFDNFSNSFCGEAGVGMPAHVRELIKNSDLILAINIRFGEMTTDAYSLLDVPVPSQKLIHVNVSENELEKYINQISPYRLIQMSFQTSAEFRGVGILGFPMLERNI